MGKKGFLEAEAFGLRPEWKKSEHVEIGGVGGVCVQRSEWGSETLRKLRKRI